MSTIQWFVIGLLIVIILVGIWLNILSVINIRLIHRRRQALWAKWGRMDKFDKFPMREAHEVPRSMRKSYFQGYQGE